MDHPQLQELADAPMERFDVEYKAWLDLDDREVRADLAKNICAIANHGGGFEVFGISDDMMPVAQLPPEAGPCDQDTLSAIVRRSLTPEFQVNVHTVTASRAWIEHPVVWVPSLVGAVAWLVWPEASRFLSQRRRRHTEAARDRLERVVSRAYRDVAKAERAMARANRRPSSARRARRAERMEQRALRAGARAVRAKERVDA